MARIAVVICARHPLRSSARRIYTSRMAKPRSPRRQPVIAHAAQRPRRNSTPAPRPADATARSTRMLNALLAPLPPALRERLHDYLVLMRLDRPIGALLLLWPTWWALWLAAKGTPPLGIWLIFTVGVFLMRAAGCVINDYADRKLDPQVARTAGRPIACGRIAPRSALKLFAALLALAFLLVLLTNRLTIELSFAGAALAALYPFSKRYTSLPQVVLGAAFGWSIPMAFAAVQGTVPALGWLLFLANVLWSTIYDTEYAMVDRADDLEAGARSTAILFGDADLPILGVLIASLLLTLLLIGTRATLGWPWYVALIAAAAQFAWQLWIMRARDPAQGLRAFRQNNWLGMTLWLGLALALALR
jgi:4-hydroxybenzoate polyprenyltransferase